MFFTQKSLEFQENYIKKLEERLARDGFNFEEVKEIIENIKVEKMSNLPTLADIEEGELW